MHCDVDATESAAENKDALSCHASLSGVLEKTLHQTGGRRYQRLREDYFERKI